MPIVGAVFDAIIAPYNITKFCDKMDNDLIIDDTDNDGVPDYLDPNN